MSYYEDDEMELRSDEVQEILGTPPHWLVRFGMLLALVLLLILAYSSFWITYPETLTSEIKVSSEDPMRRLYASNNQLIDEILVRSGDSVQAGQTLLVFKSILTKYEDVHVLDDHIASMEGKSDSALLRHVIPEVLILGELDEVLYEFREKQEEVSEFLTGRLANLSSSEIRSKIRQQQTNINFLLNQKENLQLSLTSAQRRYDRENNLMAAGMSDAHKIRIVQEDVLQAERAIQRADSEIKNKRFEIRMLQRELENTAQTSIGNANEAFEDLRNSFKNLQRKVDIWKNEYLVISPIDGVVQLEPVSENQNVQNDQEIGQVLPNDISSLVGRASLPLKKTGEVREGQKVVVNFYSFPAQRYGAVTGYISLKNKVVAKDGTLSVEVRFPQGLRTNKEYDIEFAQDMLGDVTIVLAKKRLIQWLLDRSWS